MNRNHSNRSRLKALGASIPEYCLLLGLVACVCMGALKYVGKSVECTVLGGASIFDENSVLDPNCRIAGGGTRTTATEPTANTSESPIRPRQ